MLSFSRFASQELCALNLPLKIRLLRGIWTCLSTVRRSSLTPIAGYIHSGQETFLLLQSISGKCYIVFKSAEISPIIGITIFSTLPSLRHLKTVWSSVRLSSSKRKYYRASLSALRSAAPSFLSRKPIFPFFGALTAADSRL